MDIVKSEFASKYQGFMRIYQEIFKNIFGFIDGSGNPKINPLTTLRIFKHLSSKLSLYKSSPEN
jgi:hypothetical protein